MANTSQNESTVEQLKRQAERVQFSQLIAENRNYFGNFAEIELSPPGTHSNDTAFEELTYVGYNPDLEVLDAIVEIKQPLGYLGDHRASGSYEYIRFYVDTGSGFEHAGLAAVNVHDLPHGSDSACQPGKPLRYAASVPYSPRINQDRNSPVLPLARAILSWQSIPAGPAFPVTWGNSLDCRIAPKPAPATILDVIEDLFVEGILPRGAKERAAAVPAIPIPAPVPAPLTLAQLAQLYGGKEDQIPVHRFAYAEAYSALLAPNANSDLVASKMAQFAELKINWSNVVEALTEKDADVTFEQLDSVGLEGVPGSERIVASLRIKRSAGYSGNLSTAGSLEYVAFWADWENRSDFTYLGTAPVKVHDFKRPAGEDLFFTAGLPLDLCAHCTGAKIPKIARIRAVLSWAVPPSTTNPNAVNFWGNSVDGFVCFPGKSAGSDRSVSRQSSPSRLSTGSVPAIAGASADRASTTNNRRIPNLAFPSRSASSPALSC